MIVQVIQLAKAWQLLTPFGSRVVLGDLPEALSTLMHLVLPRCSVVQGGTKIEIRTNSEQLVTHVADINSKLRPSDPYPVDGDLVNNTLFWVAARSGVTFLGALTMAKTTKPADKSSKAATKPAAKTASKPPTKPATKPAATKSVTKPETKPPKKKAEPKVDESNLLECDILGLAQVKYEAVDGFGIRVHNISLTPGIATLVSQLLNVEIGQMADNGLTPQDDSPEEAEVGNDDGDPEYLEGHDALPPDDDDDLAESADGVPVTSVDDEDEEDEGLDDDQVQDDDSDLLDDPGEADEEEDDPIEEDDEPISVGDDEESIDTDDDDQVVVDDDDQPIDEEEMALERVETPKPSKQNLPKGQRLSKAQEAELAAYIESVRGKLSSYSDSKLRAAGIKYLTEPVMAKLNNKITPTQLVAKIVDVLAAEFKAKKFGESTAKG